MLFQETIKVPRDRIGVIVGRDGKIKKRLEDMTNVDVEISDEGVVKLTGHEDSQNPVLAWKARNIIRAMARGFSPENAFTLMDDDARLVVISLRDIVGSSPRQIRRVAGRIIGEDGKTRKIIEQTTETIVSVYGYTVSIIGYYPGLDYARKAINLLISGAPHSSVYSRLESMRRDLNRYKAQIWEESDF
ncbi:MAG: KH domain-containing protein [Promethearchaeia archaeon]